jgi:hypothetical protein
MSVGGCRCITDDDRDRKHKPGVRGSSEGGLFSVLDLCATTCATTPLMSRAECLKSRGVSARGSDALVKHLLLLWGRVLVHGQLRVRRRAQGSSAARA